MRVLSIDDSKSVHLFIKMCLAHIKNVEIVDLYDGNEALPYLKEVQNKVDIILLDWEMPILTGPKTLKQIRENNITTPIIMVTSKNEIMDIALMLKEGANDYIMKPFTPDILIEKIENTLQAQLIERN